MEYNKVILSDFCCTKLYKEVQLLKDNNPTKTSSVTYDISWRHFTIDCVYHPNGQDMATAISHCPWCGTKLPKDLSDEWYDTLEKEYNITDPIVDDREKVPKEFWTDEWWKKREL